MFKVLPFLMLALTVNSAFALNGLRPIGVSAASRSQGGTGVGAYYNDYEAIYKNPSLLSFSPKPPGYNSLHFGLTYGIFKSKIKATYGDDQEFKQPIGSNAAIFPSSLGLGYKISDRFSYAIGFYGGGGGADYGEAKSVFKAKSRTIAYTISQGLSWLVQENTSLGFNISASFVETEASNESAVTSKRVTTGGNDQTLGLLLGASRRINENLNIGFAFQPKQSAYLKEARDIDDDGIKDDVSFSAVPLEAAAGVQWKIENSIFSLDYRFLQWSDADFLKATGWKDQHIFALGFEQKIRKNKIRLGLNAGNAAVNNRYQTNGFATTTINKKEMINLAADAFATTSALGFTTMHYTFGSSHEISDKLLFETAWVKFQEADLMRKGFYKTPEVKEYGWHAKFQGQTFQMEMIYLW